MLSSWRYLYASNYVLIYKSENQPMIQNLISFHHHVYSKGCKELGNMTCHKIFNNMKQRGLHSGSQLKRFNFLLSDPHVHYRVSPFQLSIDQKYSQLKMRNSMYSNRTERPSQQSTVLMSGKQMDTIEQQFERIKRSRHEMLPTRRSYFRDRLYKTLEKQMKDSLAVRKEGRGKEEVSALTERGKGQEDNKKGGQKKGSYKRQA